METIEIRPFFESVCMELEGCGIIEKDSVSLSPGGYVLTVEEDRMRIVRNVLCWVIASVSMSGKRLTVQAENRNAPGESRFLILTFRPVPDSLEFDTLTNMGKQAHISCSLNETSGSNDTILTLTIPSAEDRNMPESVEETRAEPYSLERLVEELQDAATAQTLFAEYIRHLEDQIHTMEAALYSRDWETVHREAHSIKGGAMNIHAPRLMDYARTLERAVKENRLENGEQMLDNIRKAYREIVEYRTMLPEG